MCLPISDAEVGDRNINGLQFRQTRKVDEGTVGKVSVPPEPFKLIPLTNCIRNCIVRISTLFVVIIGIITDYHYCQSRTDAWKGKNGEYAHKVHTIPTDRKIPEIGHKEQANIWEDVLVVIGPIQKVGPI